MLKLLRNILAAPAAYLQFTTLSRYVPVIKVQQPQFQRFVCFQSFHTSNANWHTLWDFRSIFSDIRYNWVLEPWGTSFTALTFFFKLNLLSWFKKQLKNWQIMYLHQNSTMQETTYWYFYFKTTQTNIKYRKSNIQLKRKHVAASSEASPSTSLFN